MCTSRTLMRLCASLLLTSSLANAAAYTLQDSYNSTNFFQQFSFFDGADPTNGFADYSSATIANKTGLAGFVSGDMNISSNAASNSTPSGTSTSVFLGVDHNTTNPTGGRGSVRVSSNKSYTKGLFIADIAHMPSSTCGVWPAFWTVGNNWPSNGEIDIIEGVNSQTTNIMTLHTSATCIMQSTGSLPTTNLTSANCNAGNGNTGCGMSTTSTSSYGTGFNDIGGGVYAMEWTSSAIKIFFFPRNAAMPADLTSSSPDPSTWGTPVSAFSSARIGGCEIDQHFKSQQIIFDTTFCGDWAGNVWAQDATCSKLATTCDAYVKANPEAFEEAYWLINSVKVFSQPAAAKMKREFRA